MSPDYNAAGIELYDLDAALPLFERFLEHVPDSAVGVSEAGSIVFANRQTEQLFGYDHDSLIGRSVESLIPDRFRTDHVKHRAEYFTNPSTRPMGAGLDLYGLRADGSEFPAEISLASVSSSSRVVAIAIVRDISDRVGAERERKQLETELKLNQSRRLESVGQLAGGIAHDFNNLLAVIINYADFVSDELKDRPDLRDDVEQIRHAAERATALTRQLLIFSRREIVRPHPLNLNQVLVDLEKLLRRTLGEHIELVTRFDADLWSVIADPGQLEQIALNLAVNARDAMPNGGTLEIETSNAELDDVYVREHADSLEPGRYVRLTIADNGIGMPPDVAVRAFEPFFSTKEKSEGTGLGLATVHGIVTATGGNVFLYSEEGHGTSIKIHLPASDRSVEYDGPSDVASPVGHGETVVVVEDEDSVRRLVDRILSGNGYNVVVFSGGPDALDRLADPAFEADLLLTDVVMPAMQGGELAERAVALRPELRILFMSGYSETLLAKMDSSDAAVELIEKPFTGADLLRRVNEMITSDVER